MRRSETLFAELAALGGERVVHAGSAWVLAPGVRPRRERRRRSAVSVRAAQGRGGRVASSASANGAESAGSTSASSTSSGATRSLRACSRTWSPGSRAASRPMSLTGIRCATSTTSTTSPKPSCWLSAHRERVWGALPRRLRPGDDRAGVRARRRRGRPEIRSLIRFGAGETPDQDLPSLVAEPGPRATRTRLAARMTRSRSGCGTRPSGGLPVFSDLRRTDNDTRSSFDDNLPDLQERPSLSLPPARRPPARERVSARGAARRAGGPLPARRPRLPRLRSDPGRRSGSCRVFPPLRLHPVVGRCNARALRRAGGQPEEAVPRLAGRADGRHRLQRRALPLVPSRQGRSDTRCRPREEYRRARAPEGSGGRHRVLHARAGADRSERNTARQRSSSRRTHSITSAISTRSRWG